jgi:hypothetical protein
MLRSALRRREKDRLVRPLGGLGHPVGQSAAADPSDLTTIGRLVRRSGPKQPNLGAHGVRQYGAIGRLTHSQR